MIRRGVRPAVRPVLLAVAVAALLSAALLVGGPAAAGAQEKKPAGDAAAAAKAPAKKAGGTKKPAKPASGKAKKKKRATTGPVAADDKFIIPYIGDNTFVVARLDAARVDGAALEQFLGQTTDAAAESLRLALGPDVRVIADTSGEGVVKRLRDRLARFTKAGGRHVYLLVDGDLWSPETVVVVPLRKGGADAKALTAVLKEVNEGTTDSVEEIGKALVSTSRTKIITLNARLNAAAAGGGKRGAGSDRPDLPAAFAAAGDAPLRVSLVPGESFRNLVGFGMHALPDEWGGGDPMLLARGTRWMTLAVHQKPATHLALTVQAAKAEDAAKLTQMITQGVERLKAEATPDEETKALRAKHLESVKVNQQGETITLTLAGEYFQRGVPDAMLHAMRTRFELIDGSERGSGQRQPPPGAAPPPPPPPPAAATPPQPQPPKPPVEGDGLD